MIFTILPHSHESYMSRVAYMYLEKCVFSLLNNTPSHSNLWSGQNKIEVFMKTEVDYCAIRWNIM